MLVILCSNCGFYDWAIYKTMALWSDITMHSAAYNSYKNDVDSRKNNCFVKMTGAYICYITAVIM